MPVDPNALEDSDRRALLHPFTSIADHLERGPLVIAEGEGVRVRDTRGREYLDAMAGLWCVNAGYGRREICDAIAEQARRLPFYHSFAGMGNEPSIRLAERLLPLAPARMSKVFFANSGSEANDTQVKLIWLYNNLRGRPAKKKIIARQRGYHGVTVAAASLSGLPNVHAGFDLPLPRFLHVTTPHHWREGKPGESERDFSERLARELDALIEAEGADTVAAFVAEPVMGAGGVLVPPEGYFERVGEVLRRHDVLFVADEVICGFGRLGEWFGSQRYGIEPDLITAAKGLTSGYAPMSACLISEEIWSALRDASSETGPLAHGFTYSGHPVSAAAGLANLDLLEREGLVARANTVGARLQSRLREACGDHPLVGEVRGVAMIAALELVRDRGLRTPFEPELRIGPALARELLEGGMLVRPLGNSIALSPPLILTEQEADEIVERLRRGLDALAVRLAADGVWKPS